MSVPARRHLAPLAALLTAVSTVVCCLPPVMAVAALSGTLGVFATTLRPWLLAVSFLFLGIGLLQMLHERRQCRTDPRRSLVFWICAGVVIVLTVFPQVVSTLLASLG